jgi:hypothetical protein
VTIGALLDVVLAARSEMGKALRQLAIELIHAYGSDNVRLIAMAVEEHNRANPEQISVVQMTSVPVERAADLANEHLQAAEEYAEASSAVVMDPMVQDEREEEEEDVVMVDDFDVDGCGSQPHSPSPRSPSPRSPSPRSPSPRLRLRRSKNFLAKGARQLQLGGSSDLPPIEYYKIDMEFKMKKLDHDLKSKKLDHDRELQLARENNRHELAMMCTAGIRVQGARIGHIRTPTEIAAILKNIQETESVLEFNFPGN